MRCLTWRAPLSWITTIWMWQLTVIIVLWALLPATVVLCFGASGRRLFTRWVSFWKEVWHASNSLYLHYCLGLKVIIHCEELQHLFSSDAEILLIANHRTAICWAPLWAVQCALGRLRGMKVVIMAPLRHLPGMGWMMQFMGFPFVERNVKKLDGVMRPSQAQTSLQLETLRQALVSMRDDPSSAGCVQIFPEGRALNTASIKASNAFADAQNPALDHYTQVLHPKTKGVAHLWECLDDNRQPLLLDATMAYVGYNGESPSETSLLLCGRNPSAVHIHLEVLPWPTSAYEAELAVQESFRKKEARLNAFYTASDVDMSERLRGLLGREPVPAAPSAVELSLGFSLRRLLCALIFQATGCFAYVMLGHELFWKLVLAECAVCALLSIKGFHKVLFWHAERWPQQPRNSVSASAPLL